MNYPVSILASIVVAASSSAQNEIQVDIETTGSPISVEFDEGEAINLTNVNNTWLTIRVYSDDPPGLYDIGRITLTAARTRRSKCSSGNSSVAGCLIRSPWAAT